MGNMDYVRFENTASDLADCQAALEGMLDGSESKLSHRELGRAKELLRVCWDIMMLVRDNVNVDDAEFADAMEMDDRLIEKFIDDAQESASSEED